MATVELAQKPRTDQATNRLAVNRLRHPSTDKHLLPQAGGHPALVPSLLTDVDQFVEVLVHA